MSNVCAALGFVCVLVAVGLLAGWLWALLGLGVLLVAVGYVAHIAEQSTAAPGGDSEAP